MSRLLNPRVIVALDQTTLAEVRGFVGLLDPKLCRLKVGSILFVRYGPSLLEELMQKGFDIFLDLKFHDIPATVAGACRSAVALGVWMITLHIQGGHEMLRLAREVVSTSFPLLVGVTVLTSLNQDDLFVLGIQEKLPQMVLKLAKLAEQTRLDGVVCSAHEVGLLRQHLSPTTLLITPGIRFVDDPVSDQKRALTPQQALEQGADYLVIGRPITKASHPLFVLEQLNQLFYSNFH